jgi:hypothetical protein
MEGAENFLTGTFFTVLPHSSVSFSDDDDVCPAAPPVPPKLLVQLLFRSGELLARTLEDVLSFGESSSVISPSLLDLCVEHCLVYMYMYMTLKYSGTPLTGTPLK